VYIQLDIFVSRSDQPAPVVRVDPPLNSDHSLIVAAFDVTDRRTAQTSCRHVVKHRPWRSFNFDAFAADLEESELVRNPPSDVTELFDSYNVTLADLLDKHAPLRDVKIKARPTAPWFDAECHTARVKTRKLEKAYRHQPSTESRTSWREQFTNQRILYQRKFVITGRQPSVRVQPIA